MEEELRDQKERPSTKSDHSTKDFSKLKVADAVQVQLNNRLDWQEGRMVGNSEHHLYIVQTPEGMLL